VQGLATSSSIFLTGQVVDNRESARVLDDNGITPAPRERALRGIAGRVAVYEIT
jgi:class 3 adenylate cyclase